MAHELFQILGKTLSQVYQASLDHFIAPPFCYYCKEFLTVRAVFCDECYRLILPIVSAQVQITKTQSMNVMAIGDYQEPLKTLILAKAWSDIVACNQLADLMWQKTYFKNMPCDYLVPVPLHWMRQAKRGYNQAQEIAFGLARKRNVTVESIIARRKSTPFQSSLPHQDRLGNVKDAFVLTAAHYEKYHNKNIVLVDDLMTSGATLAAAAKVLLPLKPASINALVACRVL